MRYAAQLTEKKKRQVFLWTVVEGVSVPVAARRVGVDLLDVSRYLIEATCYNTSYGIGNRRIRWQ